MIVRPVSTEKSTKMANVSLLVIPITVSSIPTLIPVLLVTNHALHVPQAPPKTVPTVIKTSS